MTTHPIEPPDSFFLSAAEGWLDLDNPAEAEKELGRITVELRQHPRVLEMRWRILAAAERWDDALAVARALLDADRDSPVGWIHQAYALRRAVGGGLSAAWDALLPAAEQFPQEPIIPYNLACYAARQGKLDISWTWLQKAVKIGGREVITKMALADADLEPLWPRLH